MKMLTRSHVWWPGLDKQVEKCAKTCIACQVNQNLPLKGSTASVGLAYHLLAMATCGIATPDLQII